jgi:RNA polymerase sigma factor (sigma-70 family)
MDLHRIINSCVKGDTKAQNALYMHTSKKMYAICIRYMKDHDLAKDLLQDSYVKIFNSINKYNGEGHIEGWMRRIVVNTCLDQIKKNKRNTVDQAVLQESLYPENEETDDAVYSPELLMEAILELDIPFRLVFNLFFIEDYSHEEISQALDIDPATSRSRLRRAKQKLNEILKSKTNSSTSNSYINAK